MLEISNLSKRFLHKKETINILDNISFSVKKNEFVSVIGPSGCGKTTLLKLIAGLNLPEEGAIKLDNTFIKSPTSKVGIVFQEYTPFPWLTVRKNLEFGPSLNKKECNKLVDYYLKITGLDRFQDYYPSKLSGGIKQRVAIARTMVNNPDVLLMDEPFGSLDTQTREKMQQLLLRIWQQNKRTVIFVTHDIDEAIFLSDRIIVLSNIPARIIKEFRIGFDRSRNYSLFKSKEYVKLKEEVRSLLK